MITEDHSQANLKSNSLIAIPNAWNKLRGCLNYNEKVLSSTFPNVIKLGKSVSLYSFLSYTKMKFFIDACFTLPPKFSANDCSLSFHLGSLFLQLTTVGSVKEHSSSPSANLYKSKSYIDFAFGRTTFIFRGPFIPRKLLSY
jgi:hypothetical protein